LKIGAFCGVLSVVNIAFDSPAGLHAIAAAHARGDGWFWLAAPSLGRIWVGLTRTDGDDAARDEARPMVGAWGWRGSARTFPARLQRFAGGAGGPCSADGPGASLRPSEPAVAASDAAFLDRVAAAVEALNAGALDKVVLARVEDWRPSARQPTPSPDAVLAALHAQQPTAFVFGVGQGGRSFVGASPELLAHVSRAPQGREVATDALAGTASLDEPPALLLESAKDRREHAYVVDAIRAALEPLCIPGTLRVPASPVVETLPHLRHLRTPVRGLLRDGVPARAVVEALHPTPAVCGAPRAAASAWLDAHEGFDRGLYAGPVGFDEGETGLWVVGLRCGELDALGARLFAGVGLVAGSEPARELAETHLKLRVMRSALAAAQMREAAHVG